MKFELVFFTEGVKKVALIQKILLIRGNCNFPIRERKMLEITTEQISLHLMFDRDVFLSLLSKSLPPAIFLDVMSVSTFSLVEESFFEEIYVDLYNASNVIDNRRSWAKTELSIKEMKMKPSGTLPVIIKAVEENHNLLGLYKSIVKNLLKHRATLYCDNREIHL